MMSEVSSLSSDARSAGSVRERVFAACEQLTEAEERITVAAVRRVAQVSMQDASDGVRGWRESRARAQAMPEPPEAVGRALRVAWGVAVRSARAEVELIAAEARQGREQAEAEAAGLVVAVTDAETARDAAGTQVEQLRAEAEAARGEARAARGQAMAASLELATEQGRRQQAEAEAAELVAAVSVAEAARGTALGQVAQLQDAVKRVRQEREEARTGTTAVQRTLTEERQARKQAEDEAAQLTTAVTEAETARRVALTQVEQLQAGLEAAHRDLEASRTAVDAARSEASTAAQKVAREQGRREQAEAGATCLRAELSATPEQNRKNSPRE